MARHNEAFFCRWAWSRLLKDGRATGDLEKELTKLHVNDEGKIGYFEFIQWWCREDDSI